MAFPNKLKSLGAMVLQSTFLCCGQYCDGALILFTTYAAAISQEARPQELPCSSLLVVKLRCLMPLRAIVNFTGACVKMLMVNEQSQEFETSAIKQSLDYQLFAGLRRIPFLNLSWR